MDVDNEDSDVPDELKEILKEQELEEEEKVDIPVFCTLLMDHSSNPPTTTTHVHIDTNTSTCTIPQPSPALSSSLLS
jgi:citrate synthase